MLTDNSSGFNASTNLSIYSDLSKDMSFNGYFSQKASDYQTLGLTQDFSFDFDRVYGFENSAFHSRFKSLKEEFEKLKEQLKELKMQVKVSNILKREILFVEDLPFITPYKKDYIYQLIHREEIPVHYRGGRKGKPTFLRSEIEQWLTERKVKSKYCVKQEAIAYLNNK